MAIVEIITELEETKEHLEMEIDVLEEDMAGLDEKLIKANLDLTRIKVAIQNLADLETV